MKCRLLPQSQRLFLRFRLKPSCPCNAGVDAQLTSGQRPERQVEQQAGTPFRSLRGWLALEESRLAAEAGADAASSPGVLGSALARGRSAWKSLAGPGERPPLPDIPGGGRAEALVQGSLQAVALTRLVPESDFIDRLIGYASSPVNEYSRFFVALACSGWDGDNVVEFLHACLDGAMEDTRRAAVAALEKTYMRWQPL